MESPPIDSGARHGRFLLPAKPAEKLAPSERRLR